MRQIEINAIMKRCHDATDKISCEEALQIANYSGKKKATGSTLFFECPNGCDGKKRLDKCGINISKNFAHCFVCNESWDATKLMASLWDVSYNQAALMYGRTSGAITEDEYKSIADNSANMSKAMKGTVKVKEAEAKAAEVSEFKRPAEQLDVVYRHLISLPAFRLTDEHRSYLKNERGLDDDTINEVGFFSYENAFSMASLTDSIQEELPTFDPRKDYWGIPGFYFVFKDETKQLGHWVFHKPYFNCIGIPIRNFDGHIIALQMRALSEKASVKYFFITSSTSKSATNENVGYGSTPSSPCGVVYPTEIASPFVYIGEGMFKMLEVAKREQAICLSVQGVNSVQDVPQTIEDALLSDYAKSRAPRINGQHLRLNVVIVFDADMYRNHGVLEASAKLHKMLKKKFPKVNIFFLVWDLNLGKGIDDLIHYAEERGIDYHTLCQFVPAPTFVALSEHCITKACGGKKKSKKLYATQEFSDALYKSMWEDNLSRFF